MSKLKVPIINILKLCSIVQKNKRRYLYVITFLKTLRDYTPFRNRENDDKMSKYWIRQSIPEIISIADKLFDEERFLEVYELLNRIQFSKEVEVLWRIARALYNLTFDEEVTKDVRWEMIDEAYNMLEMAYPEGHNSADVHKWMAIILDTRNGLISLETRVKNASIVRDHLEKACELNPRDFTAQYMLGKWCFEMSQLNWFQRFIAKYFIATDPPRSSFDDAYRHLSKAEELQPRTFLPNIYLLGKTCLKMGQFYKAKYYLNLAINLPPRDDCEKCCVTKAQHLIKKLDRYDLGKDVLFYDSYPFGFSE